MIQEQKIDSAVETAINYYKSHNLPIPNNVVEYIASYPKGMSRQAIQSNYGLKCSEFVKLLSPTYSKPKDAITRANLECERLGYTIISDTSTLTNNRNLVTVTCNSCGTEHTTSITSLYGSKLGCLACKVGNLPWYRRVEELDTLLLDKFEAIRVSDIPSNQEGYLTVKHTICNTEYTTQLLGIVSPNSPKRGTCPTCRDTDRRVVYEGITFGSQFELDCYKVLISLSPSYT